MTGWLNRFNGGKGGNCSNRGRGHHGMGKHHGVGKHHGQIEDNLLRLNQCDVGEKVRVRSLTMKGNKSRRLMDMGLLPGTIIEISRVAPFGDPVAIKLRGFEMSFRRQEAKGIIVEQL